jgi:hypothetical protein
MLRTKLCSKRDRGPWEERGGSGLEGAIMFGVINCGLVANSRGYGLTDGPIECRCRLVPG